MYLSLSFLVWILSLAGVYRFGKFLLERLRVQLTFSLLTALVGLVPAALLQVLLSTQYWFMAQNPLPSFKIYFSIFYMCWGLEGVYQLLKARSFRSLLSKEKMFFFVAVFALYLPALLLRGAFKSSWDFDFIHFWFEKVYSLSQFGYLSASRDFVNTNYFSYIIYLLGLVLAPTHTPLEAVVFIRVTLLCFLALSLYEISSKFSSPLKWLLPLSLLSGFPIKWINGYQDCWVALLAIFSLSFILEKNWSALFYALAFLAGVKDEGLAAAFYFLLCALWLSRGAALQNLTYFALLTLVPPLVWKLFSWQNHLSGTRLKIPDSLAVMGDRLIVFLEYLARAVGRGFQSWFLEGFVCTLLLLWRWKKLSPTFRSCFMCLHLVLWTPFLGIFLSPHANFSWHLETTISRIGSAGLLGLVYLAFYWLETQNRPYSNPG